MKLRRILSSIAIFSLVILACSPDDPDFVPVEDRDRTEQQTTDKAILLDYLQSHYYNSGALSSIQNPEVSDIVITELAEGQAVPVNHTLLIGAVETKTTTFEDTLYEYYILKINQGGGEASPDFTDKVRVEYEGTLIEDASVFDSAVNPVDFDLVGFGVNAGGVITGWQRVFPEFNEASSFTTGSNVQFDDYGVGVMFLPSGLAYFSSQLVGIPSYSNLIFKFALFQTEVNDHDVDGIPSYLEDLNANLDVFDEDTDENLIVNYVDPDDDGDGVLTRNELERIEYVINVGGQEPTLANNEFELSRVEEMGMITITTGTIVDTDSNNVPDYLDADITIDYSDDN
ncbi:MAG: hypothetical protein EVB11_05640 [Winogradskyella sp.]|nr:MAG: hypothetical protein EVB11_05640 [Winogradskyella sp.]